MYSISNKGSTEMEAGEKVQMEGEMMLRERSGDGLCGSAISLI